MRNGEFVSHLIEPCCQSLEFVARGNLNTVVELLGADLFGAFLQNFNRPRYAPREPIGQPNRQYYAD